VYAGLALRGAAPAPQALFAVAAAAHHRVQGSGSGIDVAASCWGGMIRFQRGEVRPLAAPSRSRVPAVIWSGASAPTGPRVAAWQAWSGRDAFTAEFASLADRWPAEPIATVREAWRRLCAMAAAAGIAYRTPALDRIVALAEAHGGAAKPSGAGGGDCAIAFFPDTDAEEAFTLACAREGLSRIPLSPAPGAQAFTDDEVSP
jgi:phosphomevalonate kinase